MEIRQFVVASGWNAVCFVDDPPHYGIMPLAVWAFVATGHENDECNFFEYVRDDKLDQDAHTRYARAGEKWIEGTLPGHQR